MRSTARLTSESEHEVFALRLAWRGAAALRCAPGAAFATRPSACNKGAASAAPTKAYLPCYRVGDTSLSTPRQHHLVALRTFETKAKARCVVDCCSSLRVHCVHPASASVVVQTQGDQKGQARGPEGQPEGPPEGLGTVAARREWRWTKRGLRRAAAERGLGRPRLADSDSHALVRNIRCTCMCVGVKWWRG